MLLIRARRARRLRSYLWLLILSSALEFSARAGAAAPFFSASFVSLTLYGDLPNGVIAADVNNDGRLDLISSGYRLNIFIGRGDGTFLAPSAARAPPSGSVTTNGSTTFPWISGRARRRPVSTSGW